MEGAKNFKYALGKETAFKTKAAAGLFRLPLLGAPGPRRNQAYEKVAAVWGAVSRPKDALLPSTYSMEFSFEVPGAVPLLGGLLELALGAANAGVYTIADSLPSFTFFKASTLKSEAISGCKVRAFRLASADSAQALRLAFDVVGSAHEFETSPTTIPAYASGLAPLIHKGSALTVGGGAFRVNSIALNGIWAFDEADFKASETRASLGEDGLVVVGEIVCDWDAATFNAFQDRLGSGAPVSLAQNWASGTRALLLEAPVVVVQEIRPLDERGRARQLIRFECVDTAPGARDAVRFTVALT
jgi:hypothetical protein